MPPPDHSAPSPSPPDVRYPFPRTSCACRMCSISCEHLPGALSPSDLPIIAAHLGYTDPDAFARDHLVASEGPTLALRDGRVISLPTLVPSTNADGACRYYTDGRCAIHAVSPFGCSHIDSHMPEAEFTRRSNTLYAELLDDHARAGPYARTAAAMQALGRIAPPIEMRSARLAEALRREAH